MCKYVQALMWRTHWGRAKVDKGWVRDFISSHVNDDSSGQWNTDTGEHWKYYVTILLYFQDLSSLRHKSDFCI